MYTRVLWSILTDGSRVLYMAALLVVFSFYSLNLVIILTMVFFGKVNSYLLLL